MIYFSTHAIFIILKRLKILSYLFHVDVEEAHWNLYLRLYYHIHQQGVKRIKE